MAAIIETEIGKRKGRRRISIPRVDMTPMVDLGFLLITFFILTTSMTEPRSTDLIMRKDGPEMPVKQSHVLTVVLNGDQSYVYEGMFEEALKLHSVRATSLDISKGLGQVIRNKKKLLGSGREKLLLIIKPMTNASYGGVVRALDETLINQVKNYAIAEPTVAEKEFFSASLRM